MIGSQEAEEARELAAEMQEQEGFDADEGEEDQPADIDMEQANSDEEEEVAPVMT